MNIKNRRFVRVTTDLPIVLNGRLHARIIDISEGGVKISCVQSVAFDILPINQHTPGPVYDGQLDLEFNLEKSASDKPVKCQASLIFFSRLAQDEYHFGCQFIQLPVQGYEQIRAYVQACLFTPEK